MPFSLKIKFLRIFEFVTYVHIMSTGFITYPLFWYPLKDSTQNVTDFTLVPRTQSCFSRSCIILSHDPKPINYGCWRGRAQSNALEFAWLVVFVFLRIFQTFAIFCDVVKVNCPDCEWCYWYWWKMCLVLIYKELANDKSRTKKSKA